MVIHLCAPSHAVGLPPTSRRLRNSTSSAFLRRPLPCLKMHSSAGTVRLRHVFRAAADQPCEPSPEEDPKVARYRKYREDMDKFNQEYAAALQALGAPQDLMLEQHLEDTLFRDEEDKLHDYFRKLFSNHCILYVEGRTLALMVCSRVQMAIQLSALVTAVAHFRVDASSEMSSHTVKQIIGSYVSTFLKTAEEACHRKFDKTNIISFLHALRGLAAISHILFEDTLAAINNIEGSSPHYCPGYDVEALNNELQCSMKELETRFMSASRKQAYQLIDPTLTSATDKVSHFVIRITDLRRKALVHGQALCVNKEKANDKRNDTSAIEVDPSCGDDKGTPYFEGDTA